ncbi:MULTISPECIES: hypothetical protein [unclassified Duganella]|uniref:hypothetical protein n=1 Tax=unclassified Duganella TaxID=2636909 RepID=UPI00088229B4|nr:MULTISPECIES: hypothetical protein [unclassified Duganella]SDG19674.1 hypothetical protein SAMN05216320_103206 [Duganella sp. OV458]SDJ28530.1 hypothetical protein SAMN05428973_103280 [Duganella sp. OV510]
MLRQQHINTDAKVKDDGVERMPHERDESPDGHPHKERSVIKQAAADIDSGMVDTDLHNQRGVQKPREDAKAQPLPNVSRD